MSITKLSYSGLTALLLVLASTHVGAQNFRVQCPNGTALHKSLDGKVDSMIVGDLSRPTAANANPQIKCQHISGGDGFATMADGQQIYLFGFGALSGLADLNNGLPGTEVAKVFNGAFVGPVFPGDGTTPNNAAITEPALMMNNGVLSAQAPGPMMAIDEDDEFFLTLSNVGMIMRPDLFEQHTVHFHGYPNASSFFDGVPDASVAINIAGSFTYYYTAPDAGTYFWHCHITPPEHLQMGMVGQLFVRPRQNRLAPGENLYIALHDYLYPTVPISKRVAAHYPNVSFPPEDCKKDILCSTPLPGRDNGVVQIAGAKYAYNDGDGSTRYDVEYPIQMMGFDPNFHFIGMTFNPEPFADMKDKYFLLSGRGYPDTIGVPGYAGLPAASTNPLPGGAMTTAASDGVARESQVQPTLITINKTGGQTRALLRVSNLSVTEYHTLATVGVPMLVIGFHARLLRDTAGENLYYTTNSVTIGGGESADVILDVSMVPVGTYFLYTTQLDHLSNDAENFGGMMTEIHVL
ncbi:multicopper oxidase domain-containing protein [Glaciimonas immobilis]|uniref:FtsP/CotA-like multicopper oxidase with cupredoxin domain n=1 Tax=Glaciimonas immobilis TaxID=728004 RepID=A0A840RVF5_9BURK|nr:multicopper oxidase domain-containing protein [Glaciimonas immobilis]KAF3996031.1 multicopper oxidase domain-containing protein [Glaciimonas immobilis]MBB5201845.1 FtsP/CotA-like multicopper oxidase with cupredoxin domain [Glaciimonas immobilis]